MVAASPDQIYMIGKQLTQLVKAGPLRDALKEADVVFATPIGAADRTVRRVFRPDFIISDESPRHKEITLLTLIANFSPRAYFCLGDHLQLKPTGFSKHQHRRYKPPRSFKAATTDETSAVVLTSSDEPGQDEASKAAETKTEIADFAAARRTGTSHKRLPIKPSRRRPRPRMRSRSRRKFFPIRPHLPTSWRLLSFTV